MLPSLLPSRQPDKCSATAKRLNLAIVGSAIACALLIRISFWTGWIDSVRFSLTTVIGLALVSPSACIQPESTRW
jgi:hypothetical protein